MLISQAGLALLLVLWMGCALTEGLVLSYF